MAGVYRDPGRIVVSFKSDTDGKSQAGMEMTGGMFVHLNGGENEQLKDIILIQLPEMLELFIKKNSEYGAGDPSSGTALGARGQYADIWRKVGKLKTGLWDGREDQLTTESVDEILRDMIGHCLLALQMRAAERAPKERDVVAELAADNAALRARLRHFESPDWPGRDAVKERAGDDRPDYETDSRSL